MARITLRQLLDHAAERGYGVPAFNINNMEQGLAIMEAAAAVDAPVGTAGNASRIRVVPLADKAKRYRAGALDPRIGEVDAAA